MAGIVPMIPPMIPTQNLDSNTQSNGDMDNDEKTLLTCGICQKFVDNPKYLPCLHTFCSKCIVTITRTSTDDEGFVTNGANENESTRTDGDEVIQCPICHQTTKSPGFDALPTNIIITKMKDEKLARDKLKTAKQVQIQCTNCTRTLRNAVARCVACDDFMCQRCLESHNMIRALKQHLVITIDEFHMGKVPQRSGLPRADMCPTHKGEILRFYCETCGVVMCRDCTVVDHPRPEHRHVDIQEAIQQQNKNIQLLSSQCAQLEQNIKCNIDASCKISDDVKKAIGNAKTQLDEFVDEVKSNFLESLEKSRCHIHRRLTELEQSRNDVIRDNIRHLEQVRSRVDISLSMSQQLQRTQLSLDSDAASAYAMVSSALKNLCNEKVTQIDEKLASIKFNPAEQPVFILSDIGKVHDGLEEDQSKTLSNLPSQSDDLVNEEEVGTSEMSSEKIAELGSPKLCSTQNDTDSFTNPVQNVVVNGSQSSEDSASTPSRDSVRSHKQCKKESRVKLFNKDVVDGADDDTSAPVVEKHTYVHDRKSSSTYTSSTQDHSHKSNSSRGQSSLISSDNMSNLTSQSTTCSRDADLSSNASSSTHKPEWILERSFGHKSNGETSCAWNVVINNDGDIVVTNERSLGMSVFGRDGRYKHSLPTKSRNRDALIINDEYYVTSRTKFVRVYDGDGRYLRQFHAVAPASSSKLLYTVHCLAQDKATGLLVLGASYSRSSCLSIHHTSGNHVNSIKIAIEPTFIAVTLRSIFIVSSHPDQLVHMVDPTSGRALVTLSPTDGIRWSPSGICCSQFDDIYVANRATDKSRGVYRFSASGEYMGCVTIVVASPYGLALTDDDHRMIVADYQSVKVFRLKCH